MENPEDTIDVQYGPSHEVTFVPGGQLEMTTGVGSTRVNSLHAQGVDRLGEGLDVEATADDGLVEAFTVKDSAAYSLGVQWHPEWKLDRNPVSMAIFRTFGAACRAHSAAQST